MCLYPLPLDPETYFSVFKLWFTLRESANTEAPDFPTLFPARLKESMCTAELVQVVNGPRNKTISM